MKDISQMERNLEFANKGLVDSYKAIDLAKELHQKIEYVPSRNVLFSAIDELQKETNKAYSDVCVRKIELQEAKVEESKN